MRKDVWIKVLITIQGSLLNFEIKNSKNANQNNNNNSKGIGLNNIKKRLDLLFKDNYKLEIKDKGSSFYVNLQIELNGISNEG